jgi:hypothetical protein
MIPYHFPRPFQGWRSTISVTKSQCWPCRKLISSSPCLNQPWKGVEVLMPTRRRGLHFHCSCSPSTSCAFLLRRVFLFYSARCLRSGQVACLRAGTDTATRPLFTSLFSTQVHTLQKNSQFIQISKDIPFKNHPRARSGSDFEIVFTTSTAHLAP